MGRSLSNVCFGVVTVIDGLNDFIESWGELTGVSGLKFLGGNSGGEGDLDVL
jgi:hypothetical protein